LIDFSIHDVFVSLGILTPAWKFSDQNLGNKRSSWWTECFGPSRMFVVRLRWNYYFPAVTRWCCSLKNTRTQWPAIKYILTVSWRSV